MTVTYEGRTYRGTAVKVAPVAARPLGTGTVPPCRDTPDAADEPPKEIELVAIEEASPDIAVAPRDDHAMVFIGDDVDFDNLPPALARLLETPRRRSPN